MSQDEKVSRYEVNRNVRMVITRHDVDMTRIDYSFMGSTVYLNGDLVRLGGDFSPKEIEIIVREIVALPHVRDVQFDLNNWMVASSGDSWEIKLRKKESTTGKTGRTGLSDDSTVVIEKAEDLEVVLDEIEAAERRKG
ncbi:MAG: hypothetical protein CVU71_08270 [Deltaproteobacteria bacterium HGW-Deltaproteobacteria-6]|jgi:hypothetical protein|nr:MAG: hypothetical protein CVU71_08270 [Deltaproteobacteria bacterium HGW-Deltaproteobacteria-6]